MSSPEKSIVDRIRAARRVSTPLVAITTPDPAGIIEQLVTDLNGDSPKIVWDVVNGLTPRNENGKQVVNALTADMDETVGNPTAAAVIAMRFPEKSILFLMLAHRWLDNPSFLQAVWNLRDRFKQDRRTLIMLSPSIDLPAELAGDVVIFDEPLPDAARVREIIAEQFGAAKLTPSDETLDSASEAVQGLPAFQVEQVAAMSLTKKGIDLDALWERKRRQIELTPGLKVYRDGTTFDEVGGVEVIKNYLGRILDGNDPPHAVVFIDEIEKMLAGSRGDTSGVAQDQLGTLLAYMQDEEAVGVIFVGPPGSAKSMVAKAAGNGTGIPTIQLDLGAAKGSLVGQSEHQLRTALKVITSVSNGRSLWIATCNSIGELPPELKRRFTLGTFFFDLPSREERDEIWIIHAAGYDRDLSERPDDEGWTGAEIKQCCEVSWRLNATLQEAAAFIVPVSRSAADQIEKLRKLADGRFLSASRSGVYRSYDQQIDGTSTRQVALAD